MKRSKKNKKSVSNGGYGRGASFVLGKGTKVVKSRKREASRKACRGRQCD